MATNPTELIDTGERRDARGRLVTPATRRHELVEAYKRSGLSQAAFARREGLRYSTFAHWVQQGTERPALTFAQVQLPPSAAPALEVRFADGTILRGERAADVAILVKALRR